MERDAAGLLSREEARCVFRERILERQQLDDRPAASGAMGRVAAARAVGRAVDLRLRASDDGLEATGDAGESIRVELDQADRVLGQQRALGVAQALAVVR